MVRTAEIVRERERRRQAQVVAYEAIEVNLVRRLGTLSGC
jgi:hypothetical protein